MHKRVFELLWVAGLAAIVGIGLLHAAANPAVLAVCLLIALVYLLGVVELQRYRRATAGLDAALDALSAPPPALEAWLQRLDPALRGAVERRVAGASVALPAPTLPAYLSGVLVLLGMLGTLLGMMATLRGTGMALETAVDLQAIRDSLAAPVKGLGYAFGTSIAGIAGSVALGLLAALCRRGREAAQRRLDGCIAGPLRGFGREHRQELLWAQLQAQGAQLPAIAGSLQALAEAMDRRDAAAHRQHQESQQALLARQEAFHARSETAQQALAESMRQSLDAGTAQVVEAARALLQPMAQATLDDVTRSARDLHQQIAQELQAQAQEVTGALRAATTDIAGLWTRALDAQQQASAARLDELRAALLQWSAQQDAHGQALASSLAGQLQAAAASGASAWARALEQQQALLQEQLARQQAIQREQDAGQRAAQAQLLEAVARQTEQLSGTLAAGQQAAQQALLDSLGAQWQQIGEAANARQQQACDVLQRNAEAIATLGQQQVEATLAQVGSLLQAASDAPRAAGEVIDALRQSLSESLQRDAAMLDERNQLLATLGTLLDALNRASGEQQAALDGLLERAGNLLEQTAARVDARIEEDARRLDAAATRTAAGALEIAAIGDAFAGAVDAFSASNDQLAERLQRLEQALEQSLSRSDEQLAYYVAQAREVVDLSLLSQRQIVDDLRRLGEARMGADAA